MFSAGHLAMKGLKFLVCASTIGKTVKRETRYVRIFLLGCESMS